MIKQKRILLVAAVGGVGRAIPRSLRHRLYIRSIDIQRQNPGLGLIIPNTQSPSQSRLVVTLSLIQSQNPGIITQNQSITQHVQQVAEPEKLSSCSEQAKSTVSKHSLLRLMIDQYLCNIARSSN